MCSQQMVLKENVEKYVNTNLLLDTVGIIQLFVGSTYRVLFKQETGIVANILLLQITLKREIIQN